MINSNRIIILLVAFTVLISIITPTYAQATSSTTPIFSDDFESGNLLSWNKITKTPREKATVSQSVKLGGHYSALLTTNADGGIENAYLSRVVDLNEVYVRGFFNVYRGLPLRDNSDRFYLIRLNGANQALAYAGIRRVGGVDRWTLYIRNGINGYWIDAASPLPRIDGWHSIELHWKMGSPTSGVAELYVDGTKIIGVVGINTASYGVAKRVDAGVVNAVGVQNKLTVYVDDFSISTSVSELVNDAKTLTISTVGQGTVSRSPDQASYLLGSSVKLTPVAASGWTFTGWSGDAAGSINPLTITMDENKSVTATFTQTTPPTPTPTYTISISGSNYIAKNQANIIIATNQDYATMMNNLDNTLHPSDTVLIKNGVYTITKTIHLTKDEITYIGESTEGTILRASSGCTSMPFIMCSTSGQTGNHPSNCIVEQITFDANLNPFFGSFLEISGQYNVIQNCRFINAMQYCLVMCSAHDFKILNNYFKTSEYAISTGSNAGPEFASGGEIAYNTIRDGWACGIKLKFVRDTWVHDNDIDTAYFTDWVSYGYPANGCAGIRYYQLDGPTVNVRVEDNHIYDSKKTTETWGIVVDQDKHLDAPSMNIPSSGQVIDSNLIESVYHGIWVGSKGVTVTNNIITGCVRGIENFGSGTILSGNVIS